MFFVAVYVVTSHGVAARVVVVHIFPSGTRGALAVWNGNYLFCPHLFK